MNSKSKEFLETAHLYHLGELPTEQPHPLTDNLSEMVNTNLMEAIECLKKADVNALEKLKEHLPELKELCDEIKDTLQTGGRVFLCGCGATGRLSLTLDFLFKKLRSTYKDSIFSFMAGGDTALVHAIEGFEDYPEYGAKQLEELGFKENDLLIASTEGGETPWVIGAAEKSIEISKRRCFFLYCNPRDVLEKHVERSRKVIHNPRIKDICLYVGNMSITGSTRMQASTALQLAIGLCLFYDWEDIETEFENFFKLVSDFNWNVLEKFIEIESNIYLKGDYINYNVDEDYAICAFTDTTERAPTFSLKAFNHLDPSEEPSLCHIQVHTESSSTVSWNKILNRKPNNLNWPNNPKLSNEYLQKFDFSTDSFKKREAVIKVWDKNSELYSFNIHSSKSGFRWEVKGFSYEISIGEKDLFIKHMFLKLMLNTMSTLIMGKLGRYQNNLMTYVSPSNGKLIDRAARYISYLLKQDRVSISYQDIVECIFSEMENSESKQPIVIRCYQNLKANIKKGA